jgi:hypothetical protein
MSDQTLPHVDFSTFVLSLGHSALIQLGEAPHPDTQHVEADLPLARQTIDLLSVLEEKTKGNLTGEEERLLSQLLYDLRLRCVEKEKETSGSGKR